MWHTHVHQCQWSHVRPSYDTTPHHTTPTTYVTFTYVPPLLEELRHRADKSRFITPFECLERNNADACFVRDFMRGTLGKDEIWNLKARIMLRYRKLHARRALTQIEQSRFSAKRAFTALQKQFVIARDVIYLLKQPPLTATATHNKRLSILLQRIMSYQKKLTLKHFHRNNIRFTEYKTKLNKNVYHVSVCLKL